MMHRSDRPFVWHLIYLAEACWMLPHLKRQQIDHLHAHFGPIRGSRYAGERIDRRHLQPDGAWPRRIRRAPSIHLRGEDTPGPQAGGGDFVLRPSQLFRIADQESWDKIQVFIAELTGHSRMRSEHDASRTGALVCVGGCASRKDSCCWSGRRHCLAAEGRAFELVLVGDGEHRP